MAQSRSHAWSLALTAAAGGASLPHWLAHRLAAVEDVNAVAFLDVDARVPTTGSHTANVVAVTTQLLITARCDDLEHAVATADLDHPSTVVVVRPLNDVVRLEVAGQDGNWRGRDGNPEPRMGEASFRVVFRNGMPEDLRLPLTSLGLGQWPAGLEAILASLRTR